MAISPDSISFWIFAATAGFFKWLQNKNRTRWLTWTNMQTTSIMNAYSCKARGSLCICSKIILMAGSLKIFWTSGSAMAFLRTSSGFALVSNMHARYPSSASYKYTKSKKPINMQVNDESYSTKRTYGSIWIELKSFLICRRRLAVLTHPLENFALPNPSLN